jgi:hypothetical protein
MRTSKFTPEQMVAICRQGESGVPVGPQNVRRRVCRSDDGVHLGRSRFLWTLDKKELTSDRDDDDDAASGRSA